MNKNKIAENMEKIEKDRKLWKNSKIEYADFLDSGTVTVSIIVRRKK